MEYKKGFSEILVIVLVGIVALGGAGYWYFYIPREETIPTAYIPTNLADNMPTPTPDITEPSYVPSTYTSFPNEDFDFISMDIPQGWTIETKYFGETNDLDFPSFHRPECSQKTCAGIRLTKGNARLEMVFDQGFDSAGYLCTDNNNYFDVLNNNWIKLNHPTDSKEDYMNRYVYSKDVSGIQNNFDPGEKANDDWYYPSLTNWDSENEYAQCITGSPLFRSERVDLEYEKLKENGEQFETPAIIATSPRLYRLDTNDIDSNLLQEVDNIISSINYTD